MVTILSATVFLLVADEANAALPWYNYPGFEVWKFVNLFLFVGFLIFLLRRPLGASMRARRESIRRELMRAQEERNAALAKLEEVNARLARLDDEIVAVRARAEQEAMAEQARIARATEEEARKLREQARREIESAAKAARLELRHFAAEQSVKLAEELLRRDISPEDDARLMQGYVEELGGVSR